MKMYSERFTLTLVVGAMFLGVDGAPSRAEVDKLIRQVFNCYGNNPAMAVAVVQDKEILFSEGYGYETLDKLVPVTNDTLFGIASLSKSFAAALLLHNLMNSDRFQTSSPLKDVYNDDNLFETQMLSKYVTIRDLLTHNTGVVNYNKIRMDDTLNRRNLYKRLKYLPAKGRFRDSFYYSNLLYGVLTHVTEIVGNGTWEDLMTEQLLSPLNMRDTTFATKLDVEQKRLTRGYINYYGQLHEVPTELSRIWGELCGSGCVMSTANDMAKWLLFHINEGVGTNGQRIVSKSIFAKQLFRGSNNINSSPTDKYFIKPIIPVTYSQFAYGAGWRLGLYRGYPILTHTGSTYGYGATQIIMPSEKLGIFIALTGPDAGYLRRTSLQLHLLDLYTGLTPWLNSSLLCSFPEPWKKGSPSVAEPFINRTLSLGKSGKLYEGSFSETLFGTIQIRFNETEDNLYAYYGYATFILYPQPNPYQFYVESTGIFDKIITFGELKFSTDLQTIEIPALETSSPPVFTKGKASGRNSQTSGGSAHYAVYYTHLFIILTFILCIV